MQCDVHEWMHAYLVPVEHPYFAITGADGSFSIDQVPPGSYTVDAWHEQMGVLSDNADIASGDTRQIHFEFRLPSPTPSESPKAD